MHLEQIYYMMDNLPGSNEPCQLDSCIAWNAHNPVFGSNGSAICAQAIYFLHSTRPSVTWLNSRWWLAACGWVMSSLSAALSTCVRRCRKFGEVSCTECTGHGNDFEFIPIVEIKTRIPIEGYFVSEFAAICNHCRVLLAWSRKTLKIFQKFYFIFFGKTTPYGKIFFKILFRKFSSRHRSVCCVQISWNLAKGKLVKSCVAYLAKKKILPGSPAVTSARIAPKICHGQPPAMYSECSRFHPNRLTFGGVIAEHMNTAKTRRKVNPIFGWSLASSRIMNWS